MKQLKKTLLTLVALLAVTTGAWADETPLLTIESKDYTSFKSGSMTFDDKVTITFSSSVRNDGDGDGWFGSSVFSSLLTVTGINGYTITSCKFYTAGGTANTGYTVQGESPSVYLSDWCVFTDANKSVNIGEVGVKKIEVYTAAPEPSGPEVAWDKAEKTGSFNMPGGNVTLEPEYYPQAALTAAPTAINDVPATTDGAIVSAGTVATIGETTTAQGTVMYYVSQTALDDAALLALAADQWTADVPTAKSLAQGQAYVYYYVRGNDSDNDAENFSDGDILAANALTVTIAAEPTYAVTFADGIDEPDKWKAEPAADVKKGQTVTVTYTGSKKVIGVKAEKKASTPSLNITSPSVGQVIGSDGKNYAAANVPSGVDKVAMIAYVSGSNGLAIALADEGRIDWITAVSTAAAHTPVFSNGTWKLPTQDEWKQMFNANGGSNSSWAGLNDALAAAGDDNSKLQKEKDYWSSTEIDNDRAYSMLIGKNSASWGQGNKTGNKGVRACLAF